MSREKVRLLQNRDYGYLKQRFVYPAARDFNISIESSDFDSSLGTAQPELANIYGKYIESFYVNRYLEQERVTLMLTVW